MKYAIIALGIMASAAAFVPTQAQAVVCARGVVRAGCVGPRGAVAVRRPVVAVVPRAVVVAPAAVVVAPARYCHYVNGVRICR